MTAGSELVGDKHKCQHCESSFKTRNALGNHYNFCKPALARKKEEGKKMSATGMVAATVFGGSVALKKQRLCQESASYSSVSSQILNKKTTVSNKDKRKGNCGSNICKSYFPEEKLRHLEALEAWQEKQKEAGKTRLITAMDGMMMWKIALGNKTVERMLMRK